MNPETLFSIAALSSWGVAAFFAWRISKRVNRVRALQTGRDDKLLRSYRSVRP